MLEHSCQANTETGSQGAQGYKAARGSEVRAQFPMSYARRMHRAYLKGAQPKLKHEPFPLADVLRREGEHGVVDSEQWDEQQGGASQPSVRREQKSAGGLQSLGAGRAERLSPALATSQCSDSQTCLAPFTDARDLGVREPTRAQGSQDAVRRNLVSTLQGR